MVSCRYRDPGDGPGVRRLRPAPVYLGAVLFHRDRRDVLHRRVERHSLHPQGQPLQLQVHLLPGAAISRGGGLTALHAGSHLPGRKSPGQVLIYVYR